MTISRAIRYLSQTVRHHEAHSRGAENAGAGCAYTKGDIMTTDYDFVIGSEETATDPLDALFITNEDLARQIARMINGKVKIDGQDVVWLGEFPLIETIVIYLLALKAMHLTNRRSSGFATSTDITVATKLNGNSVRPLIKKLVDRKLIERRDNLYSIRVTNLDNVKMFMDTKWGRWQS